MCGPPASQAGGERPLRPDPPARPSRAAWLIALLVALSPALTACGHPRTTGQAAAETVTYQPATRMLSFALPRFAGGILRSSQLAGRPAVINFYASWCTVCRFELPAFERAYHRYGRQISFVGVNPQQGDTDAAQAALIRATGVTYPTLRDRHDLLLEPFDPSGSLPVTLFVDPTGHVVHAHFGGLSYAALALLLTRDLGARPTPS
ncbi:MAG: TlpA family protein disulfide reductase [Mycobacteriales bacterium]